MASLYRRYALVALVLLVALFFYTEAAQRKKEKQVEVEVDARGQTHSLASLYETCQDCVDAGYGWDVETEQCGRFANRDCSLADADDDDDDEEADEDDEDAGEEDEDDEEEEEAEEEEEDENEDAVDDDEDEEDDEEDDDEFDEETQQLPPIRKVNPPSTNPWANTETTTMLWQVVSSNNMPGLESILRRDPFAAHSRSEDGRGPLFWAYEYNRPDMVEMLLALGVEAEAEDVNGVSPHEMAH